VVNTLLRRSLSTLSSPLTQAQLAQLPVNRCHPLIDAVGTAFSQHRPLTLSPDAIWLVIEQGFAHHVGENAEALSSQYPTSRNRFVRHLGTMEDWQRIRARLEVIATFGLEWWVARLRAIVDEMIRTVGGSPDPRFWQAIYKPKQSYGIRVTGWIADLFPYLGEAPHRRRSHVFQYERLDWAIPVDSGVDTGPMWPEPGAEMGVEPKRFPSGLCSVPVQLNFPSGTDAGVDLVAGFIAVEQDPEDLALSPVISCSVAERAPEKPVLVL